MYQAHNRLDEDVRDKDEGDKGYRAVPGCLPCHSFLLRWSIKTDFPGLTASGNALLLCHSSQCVCVCCCPVPPVCPSGSLPCLSVLVGWSGDVGEEGCQAAEAGMHRETEMEKWEGRRRRERKSRWGGWGILEQEEQCCSHWWCWWESCDVSADTTPSPTLTPDTETDRRWMLDR